MEKGQSLEHGAKSGGDSGSSEMPTTHIGPIAENEKNTQTKELWWLLKIYITTM